MILIRSLSGHCETLLKLIGSSNGVTGRADLPDRLRVPDCLRDGGALPRRVPPAQGDLPCTQPSRASTVQAKYLCTYGRAKFYVILTAILSVGECLETSCLHLKLLVRKFL